MAIEALSDGGVLGGIDRGTSVKLAAQTVLVNCSNIFLIFMSFECFQVNILIIKNLW